jgi:Leucine-rich repeat (LRR) protein
MLNDNNITDISALSEMDSVDHLDLENNPIEDYSPLNNLSVNKLVK